MNEDDLGRLDTPLATSYDMRVSSTPPPSSEPLARGTIVHGFRAAVLDLWGAAGLREVAARLSGDTLAATIEEIILPVAWHPLRYAIAWHDAVWQGPARRDDAAYCAFIDRSVDLGFGRMQRLLLRVATPAKLMAKAPELWRHQHSRGALTASIDEAARVAVLTLREHPYVGLPLSRRLTAESYRYIASLCGAPRSPRVAAQHRTERDALVVRLSWS